MPTLKEKYSPDPTLRERYGTDRSLLDIVPDTTQPALSTAVAPDLQTGGVSPGITHQLARLIFESPSGVNLLDNPGDYLNDMAFGLTPEARAVALIPGGEVSKIPEAISQATKRVAAGAVRGATFGALRPLESDPALLSSDPVSGDVPRIGETPGYKAGTLVGTIAPISAVSKGVGALAGLTKLSQAAPLIRATAEAALVGAAYTGIEQAVHGELDEKELAETTVLFGAIPVTGMGAFRLLRFMPQRIQKFVMSLFGSPTPKPARQILREREAEIIRGQVEADTFRSAIVKNIPKHKREEAFRLLDPTAIGPPTRKVAFTPDEVRVLGLARNKMDDLGAEAVELGLLDAATYHANRTQYMGRFYVDKLGKNSIVKTLKRFFIRGNRFKARTLKTVEDRLKHGIVTDPSYSAARTISELTYDIETAKAFQKIAKNTEWASKTQVEGWKLLEGKKFGDLNGKWVEPLIFDEVALITAARGELARTYDKMLSMWKFGKTALNPATHGRNIFSNVVLAHMGGLSPLRVDIYAKAGKDYLAKGPMYQEAIERGLFSTDWYAAEIKNFTGALEKSSGSMLSRTWDVAGRLGSKTLGKFGDVYQAEEHFFKLALYSHQRSIGKTPKQAYEQAVKHLFDYSDISPLLKTLRRSPFGGPFVTFTAKALPVIAEAAVTNPARLGTYALLFKGLNEYSKSLLGISDAEYATIKESLPPWQRGGWQVLVPIQDRGGRPVLFDMTYNLPWGDIGEQGVFTDELADFVGLPALPLANIGERFVLGNPFLRVPAELLLNRNPFTGAEIVSPSEQLLGERGAEMRRHAFRQFSPSIIQNVSNVIDAALDKRYPSGEKRDLVFSVMQYLLGLKFRPVLVDRGLAIKRGMMLKDIDELESAMWRAAYDRSLSEEERQKRFDKVLKTGQDLLERMGQLYAPPEETTTP